MQTVCPEAQIVQRQTLDVGEYVAFNVDGAFGKDVVECALPLPLLLLL